MKLKIIVFFLLIIFFAPIVCESAMVAPYFDIHVIKDSIGGDATFDFDLIAPYPYSESFQIETENGEGSYFIGATCADGEFFTIKEIQQPGWKNNSITCFSLNPQITTTLVANGIQIKAYPYSSITCTFVNEKQKTPVLIVPGLMGTEMEDGSELLWADLGRMFTDFSDSFLDKLSFNTNIKPVDHSVSTADVLGVRTLGPIKFDYSDGLINEFKNQGYVENETLFTFPYDWRYGVSGEYADEKTNSDLLGEKINAILQQTGSSEVNVVAHSMGGLITKKYVMDNPANNNIGKAIFVGVPNTGSPKAVKTLLQGDNFGIPWLADSETKKIAENMPASYDLLPSQQYYDQKGSFIKVINEDVGTLQYEEKDLNYSESKSFLTGEHLLNSLALANAEALHTNSFDNFDLRTAGVDVYSINGCKTGTLKQIVERRDKNIFGGTDTGYSLQYGALPLTPGDGTVPLESATNLPIDSGNKFYLLTSKHSKMLSSDGSRQKIVNLISGSNLDEGNNLITQDESLCSLNGKAISVFSPVNIFVTDQNGNKLGLAEDGSIINEIPNADFEILGEHKFIYLPQDNGEIYDISLQGTDNGSFTIKNQDIVNGDTTKIEVFANLQVTTQLTGEININLADNTTTITTQQTPDSEPEIILPSAILIGEELADVLPPTSTATLTGTAGQPGFYKSDVDVSIKSTDADSGVLEIQYNLDNVGYQKVSGDTTSFSVLEEGVHSIKFFSTDRAGNNKLEQEIKFTIDRTAPEAVIEFDLQTKDLKFLGKDFTQVLVQDKDSRIILTDQAGNITEIKLKNKDRKKSMKAEIKSLIYNGVLADISKNEMAFSWHYDKKQNLDKLSQRVKSKRDYNISAVFDGKNTKIIGKDFSGKILQSFSGMKIIKVVTSRGDLGWTY